MAASTFLLSLFFVVLVILPTSSQAQQDQPRLNRVNKKSTYKGFRDMSEMLVSMHSILFPDLEILESKNKTLFLHSSYHRFGLVPTMTTPSLVQYHIVAFKVDRDPLTSPSMSEQKFNTLLQGHPLVVTTGLLESLTLPSLNLVAIGEWNVYNDGHLIVHDLYEFFNSDYQSARYPWFDGPEAPAVNPRISSGSCFNDSGHKYHEVF